jgi:hypothetical protein
VLRGLLLLVLRRFHCFNICEFLLRVNSDLTAFTALDFVYFAFLAGYLVYIDCLVIAEFVYSLYSLL